jgi:CRISPR system Cascade subunit CasB
MTTPAAAESETVSTDSAVALSVADDGVAVPAGTRPRSPHYWQRFSEGRMPDGADLAALRRGIDREPGTVPAMWPFYTCLTEDGRRTRELLAEHLALTLFAVHQQSKPQLMHAEKVGLGSAVLALKDPHNAKSFSPEAVDRRFGAAATATSIAELAVHLRGLITRLRGIAQPLDYTLLTRDLRDWQNPDRAPAVRRRWGGQYFAPPRRDKDATAGPRTPAGL